MTQSSYSALHSLKPKELILANIRSMYADTNMSLTGQYRPTDIYQSGSGCDFQL